MDELLKYTEPQVMEIAIMLMKTVFIMGVLSVMQVTGYSPFRNTLDNPTTHIAVRILVWIPKVIFHLLAFISGMFFVNVFVAIIIDIIKFLWIF